MDRKKREFGKDGKASAEAVSSGLSVPEVSPGKELPRTEELFRQGEDLYQLGRFQQAIHVWTRMLFLERGDSRAKSAIERSKRALAERQRELDVEIVAAAKILDDGDIETADHRVRRVLALDPGHAEGHQLAERIAARTRRSESTTSPAVAEEQGLPSKRGLLLRVARNSSPVLSPGPDAPALKMAGFAVAVILVFASGGLYLHLNWESIVSDGAFVSGFSLAPGGVEPMVSGVPGASELHYFNGAKLYANGRYREALAELSQVGRDEVVSERARSLILRIEERLLRGGELAESSRAPVEPVR